MADTPELRVRTANEQPVDYCDDCHGPVIGRSDLALDLSWIAYWLVMHWPLRWFYSPPVFALLPYSGNIAFACSCRDKNRAALMGQMQKDANQ